MKLTTTLAVQLDGKAPFEALGRSDEIFFDKIEDYSDLVKHFFGLEQLFVNNPHYGPRKTPLEERLEQ
jgi:hypothetical protein